MDILDNLLRFTAPLFRNGSQILLEDTDDPNNLCLYKLLGGKWVFRSKWVPKFSGEWNPI
jgi:hypothetical protein